MYTKLKRRNQYQSVRILQKP